MRMAGVLHTLDRSWEACTERIEKIEVALAQQEPLAAPRRGI